MSQGCNNVNGSRTKLAIIPNLTCAPAPTLYALEVTAAAAVNDSTLSIQITTAAITAAPLSPGVVLKIGSQNVEVLAPTDGSGVYKLSTAAATVINVKRLTATIAVNATFTSYLGVLTCVKTANIDTQTTSVDNTTNCTGSLYTKLNLGVDKMLKLAGYLSSADYAYHLLKTIGKDLGSFFFALDYDGRYFVTGVFQTTDPSVAGNEVKQIVTWSVDGQVQSIDNDFGSYVATAGELTLLNTLRADYGFKPAVSVIVNPVV
jgi:hypothetical protein